MNWRRSGADVLLVGELNAEIAKRFADFGVIPNYGVYPRVSAQSLRYFSERLLAGFSYSLSSFLYECKHDSPSLSYCDRNRRGGATPTGDRLRSAAGWLSTRLLAAALFVVAEVDAEIFERIADFGVVPKRVVYPRVSAQSLRHFRARLLAPLRAGFRLGFPYSLPSFVYEGKHDSPSLLRRYQNRY